MQKHAEAPPQKKKKKSHNMFVPLLKPRWPIRKSPAVSSMWPFAIAASQCHRPWSEHTVKFFFFHINSSNVSLGQKSFDAAVINLLILKLHSAIGSTALPPVPTSYVKQCHQTDHLQLVACCYFLFETVFRFLYDSYFQVSHCCDVLVTFVRSL